MLEVWTERVTVQELMRSRVYQEVKDYDAKQPEYFWGLVQLTEAEPTRSSCYFTVPEPRMAAQTKSGCIKHRR